MSDQPLSVSVIGAAVSANKGAASMFYGLLDGLADAGIRAEVNLLTTYRTRDEAVLQKREGSIPDGFTVRTVNAAPLALLTAFLLALPLRMLDRLHLPTGLLRRVPLIRAVRDSAVTVDLAGISFADGRSPALLGYNVVMSLFPYLAGASVVKGSQAIGPAQQLVTRVAAKIVLPRMTSICARGKVTREHLDSLGLDNVVDAADLAFLMHGWDRSEHMPADPSEGGSKQVVVVLPSSVVDSYAKTAGTDHVGVVAEVIDRLSNAGAAVVVAPHSFREGGERGRMNDGPVVADIERRVTTQATFINRDLDPRELRAIIRSADVAVTGRFHAMVSALEVGTPPVVVGWSHKYREVLDQFNVGGQGLSVEELSVDNLLGAVNRTLLEHDALCRAMSNTRAEVHNSARRNIDVVLAAAKTDSPAGHRNGLAMRSLTDVAEHDWCIGCGVCVHADQSLSLVFDEKKQMFQPSGPGNELALAVCPAVSVDYGELQRLVFGDVTIDEYGAVDTVYLAQSTNHDRNLAASSGGLIKELLIQLLEREDIDGAVVLSHVAGLDFRPSLISAPGEVDGLPGSIYHNLDQSDALRILLENEGRFVLVGIPCVLEGIFKYISAAAPELLDRVATTIGLLCGWQYTHHSIKAMGEYLGFDPDQITDVAYRGNGPVGKFRVTLSNGEEKSASRRVDFSYQVAFDRHFNTRRCHVCVNHSNFLADIVVGDAWLPSTLMTRTGISLVIARSERARAQMESLENDGRVTLVEVGKGEIRESQTERVVFGEFAYGYAGFLQEQDIPTPVLDGPNRAAGRRAPRRELESFHSEYLAKTELQREGRYRRLWWRKATKGFPQLAGRYWRWFTVRVLRIKSITGQRHEIERSRLRDFS